MDDDLLQRAGLGLCRRRDAVAKDVLAVAADDEDAVEVCGIHVRHAIDGVRHREVQAQELPRRQRRDVCPAVAEHDRLRRGFRADAGVGIGHMIGRAAGETSETGEGEATDSEPTIGDPHGASFPFEGDVNHALRSMLFYAGGANPFEEHSFVVGRRDATTRNYTCNSISVKQRTHSPPRTKCTNVAICMNVPWRHERCAPMRQCDRATLLRTD